LSGLCAALPRVRFFFDLSLFVLRLFFVLKTKNNRRTNEEQTEKRKLLHGVPTKAQERDGESGCKVLFLWDYFINIKNINENDCYVRKNMYFCKTKSIAFKAVN